MARLARIIAPGCPHHVTVRAARRKPIFFEEGDQDLYRDLLAEQMRRARVEVWAYCLAPNHVHLILAPETAEGSAQALGPRIGAGPISSMRGAVGAATCSRGVLRPW